MTIDGSGDTFDPAYLSWVLTENDLDRLCAAVASALEVVVDLETTGLAEYAWLGGLMNGGYPARIVLASLTLPQDDEKEKPTTWVVPLSHPDSPWLGRWRRTMRRIALVMYECRLPIINQNMKFDARWVKAHTGVDLSSLIVWDTQVSSHLLDETTSTSLKDRAPVTFNVKRWDDFDLKTPGAAERVPMFDLGSYAGRDTYWTHKLADLHREMMFIGPDADEPESTEEIEAARLGKLATWCAMPAVATLTAIEQRGMVLDVEWVDEQLAEHNQQALELFDNLSVRYPWLDAADASFAPTSTWFIEWAKAAVDAGDLRIAELTPQGKPRWSKGVLVRQARGGSETAQALLDLRGHMKKAEFLRSWLTFVTPEGRIHSTYHAGRVITGRLSSSDPNMQQVTAALKPAFVGSPGYYIADLDYSQIELRVAAFISRCNPMIEAFRRGDDLHKLLAAKITGKSPQDVTPIERQAGKSANFGLLYKMSAYGFREYAETVYGVSFTPGEAVAVHKAFYDTWEGIGAWHDRVIRRAHATGQVTSPIGRIRRLPGIFDGSEAMVGFAERAAINAPVQGFGSDLMQMAAASIEGNLPGVEPVRDARLVGTVHDDIVVEVPIDNWKEVTLECQRRMLTIVEHLDKLDCHFDVPLAVEAKVGTRWGLSDIAVLT